MSDLRFVYFPFYVAICLFSSLWENQLSINVSVMDNELLYIYISMSKQWGGINYNDLIPFSE